MEVFKCPNCGKELKEADIFCSHCGTRLPQRDDTTEKESGEIINNPNSEIEAESISECVLSPGEDLMKKRTVVVEEPKKKTKTGTRILIVLCCIIAFVILINSNNKKLVQEAVIEVCDNYNLTDTTASLSLDDTDIFSRYKLYDVDISCTGFSSFDYEQMYNCFCKIESHGNSINNIIIYKIYINSDGHFYTFQRAAKYSKESEGYVECDNNKVFTIQPKASTSSSTSSSSGSYSSAKHTDNEAKVCAEAIVKANLKSPSTAKFCKYTEMSVSSDGKGNYTVTGWVDAENSYGATLRKTFIVTYTATEKGYKDASCVFY